MKKALLSLAAFVMIIASVNAQEVSFGVKVGPNFANIGGDADGDMKVGFHIGGVANFMLSETFAFAPELLFSAQGAKDGDVKINLSYINVPLLAKLYVSEGFNVHAGPYVGFLLGAKVKADDVEVDIKDEMKGLDFGLDFGAGYELESGLNFGVRYNLGLANIADEEDYKESNQVIQLSVGYTF